MVRRTTAEIVKEKSGFPRIDCSYGALQGHGTGLDAAARGPGQLPIGLPAFQKAFNGKGGAVHQAFWTGCFARKSLEKRCWFRTKRVKKRGVMVGRAEFWDR